MMETNQTYKPSVLKTEISTASLPCKINKSFYSHKKKLQKFFMATYVDRNVMSMQCLKNYHLKSGDLVRHCENGAWSGAEPVCAANFYMEKHRLSGIIILVSLIVPMLLLLIDFLCFVKKRRSRRSCSKRRETDSQSGRITWQNFRGASFVASPSGSYSEDGVDPRYLGSYNMDQESYFTADIRESHVKTNFVPWYKGKGLPVKQSPSQTISMVGAGRHFAAIGKRII